MLLIFNMVVINIQYHYYLLSLFDGKVVCYWSDRYECI